MVVGRQDGKGCVRGTGCEIYLYVIYHSINVL